MNAMQNRVQVTAADFNGQEWDSAPFHPAPGPKWLSEAVHAGRIVPHTRGDTDYARWDVTTPKGVVDAGPGDCIMLEPNGDLHVEVGP